MSHVVQPSCGEWPFPGNELTSLGRRSDVVLTSFFFYPGKWGCQATGLGESKRIPGKSMCETAR